MHSSHAPLECAFLSKHSTPAVLVNDNTCEGSSLDKGRPSPCLSDTRTRNDSLCSSLQDHVLVWLLARTGVIENSPLIQKRLTHADTANRHTHEIAQQFSSPPRHGHANTAARRRAHSLNPTHLLPSPVMSHKHAPIVKRSTQKNIRTYVGLQKIQSGHHLTG